jgi:predicted O-methyltransferase YrrM
MRNAARRVSRMVPWAGAGSVANAGHRFGRSVRKKADAQSAAMTKQDLDSRLRSLERSMKGLADNVVATRKQIDHLPYLIVELARRQAELFTGDQPMPTLGANWAATPPTILFIVDEIFGPAERRVILECGSGASTLWTAAALRRRGEGHVTTLEHDTAFAEETRRNLRAHGLHQWATVLDAPLTHVTVEGVGRQPWYDLSGLGDVSDVDLLFVDGPPRLTARLARYPAVPLLLSRLSPGALVVLDDANRQAERTIAEMWSKPDAFQPALHVLKQVGRSIVLQVGRVA